MFFGSFGVDDFMHHRGSEVALCIEMEPGEKGYDLVKHGKEYTEYEIGKKNTSNRDKHMVGKYGFYSK